MPTEKGTCWRTEVERLEVRENGWTRKEDWKYIAKEEGGKPRGCGFYEGKLKQTNKKKDSIQESNQLHKMLLIGRVRWILKTDHWR